MLNFFFLKLCSVYSYLSMVICVTSAVRKDWKHYFNKMCWSANSKWTYELLHSQRVWRGLCQVRRKSRTWILLLGCWQIELSGISTIYSDLVLFQLPRGDATKAIQTSFMLHGIEQNSIFFILFFFFAFCFLRQIFSIAKSHFQVVCQNFFKKKI